MKTLDNVCAIGGKGTRDQVPDVQIWGDGDAFQLLCKASSREEQWMKSTKAMAIPGLGCVVQVTTQQSVWDCEKDCEIMVSVAEAVCFVPGAFIEEDVNDGKVVGRHLRQGIDEEIGMVFDRECLPT